MKIFFAALLVAGAAAAQETEKPTLVISSAANASTAGAEIGLYNDAGPVQYGLSALVTGGDSTWAGAFVGGRWTLLSSTVSPYLGLGIGAFSARRGSLDLGVQPTASVEAGVSVWRLFAGARALLPLSTRSEGPAAHDTPGIGNTTVLAQVGIRL